MQLAYFNRESFTILSRIRIKLSVYLRACTATKYDFYRHSVSVQFWLAITISGEVMANEYANLRYCALTLASLVTMLILPHKSMSQPFLYYRYHIHPCRFYAVTINTEFSFSSL
jgi:hypothetical protein